MLALEHAVRASGFLLCWLALCSAGGCDQTEAPARRVEPAAPATPAASPKAATEPVAPQLPTETPSATAPPQAAASDAPHAAPKRKVRSRPVREIHPQRGQSGCLQMYGSCTSGPDRICTSEAYYLDCGKRGQLPGTGEPLHCVCP